LSEADVEFTLLSDEFADTFWLEEVSLDTTVSETDVMLTLLSY
jgi:hypothetical protein